MPLKAIWKKKVNINTTVDIDSVFKISKQIEHMHRCVTKHYLEPAYLESTRASSNPPILPHVTFNNRLFWLSLDFL